MIQMIKLDDLENHPNNVRKKYDGIEELAASIKEEGGVLQNLTVVPNPNKEGKYWVVIGNRRLIAAREAGIEEVPCVIDNNMSEQKQIKTMITENMNRKGLTVVEESKAIQMCIKDFGVDVDTLNKELGISKTTINHRLNIAKLDMKVLEKKSEDKSFQLSLGDLYALEKVENIKTRNKILKEAGDSRDLSTRAIRAANDELYDKHEKEFIELAKKRGCKKAPKNADNEFYSGKWDRLADWNLSDKVPKQLKIEGAKDREIFYLRRYNTFYIIAAHKKEKKVLSKYEIEQKEKKKVEREIKGKYKAIMEDMNKFVVSIIDGSTKPINDISSVDETLWEIMLKNSSYLSYDKIAEVLLGKDLFANSVEAEDRDRVRAKARELSGYHQRLAICCSTMKGLNLVNYENRYKEESAETLKKYFKCLKVYGYSWPDEESTRLVEGEHELYVKNKEE